MPEVPGGVQCSTCDKKVWDLRDASADEASALFKREGTSICVRVRSDASGKAILRESAKRRRRSSFVLATSLIASAAACSQTTAGEPEFIPEMSEATDQEGVTGTRIAHPVETAGEPEFIPEMPETSEEHTDDEVEDENETAETLE